MWSRVYSYWTVFLALLGLISADVQTVCQYKGSLPVIERHFYHHIPGTNYYAEKNITLPQSLYFPERLINELIKQLLSSKLGYYNVSYVDTAQPYVPLTTCTSGIIISQNYNVDNTYNPSLPSPTVTNISNSCIQLDALPEALLHLRMSKDVMNINFEDVGSLGIATRYGFYMTTSEAQTVCDAGSCRPLISLLNSFSKFISYTERTMQAYAAYIGCPSTAGDCVNITYQATGCNSTSCALLLVGDTNFPMEVLQAKIETSHLPLMVLYVGENLTSFSMNLTMDNIPIIFFSRSYELLTFDEQFTRVRPWNTNCALFDDDHQFAMQDMRKVIWNQLGKLEPLIYKFLKNMYINESLMMSLIEDYIAVYDRDVSALSVTNFIRDWISNHEDLVCQWLPDGAIEKPTLYIGGFFPLWVESVYREPSLVTAAGIAINLVNKDEKFLNKYKLEMIVNDTKCEASDVLKIFTQYVADDNIWPQMIGGLGPACSDTALGLAALAKHYNYVIISSVVTSVILSLDRMRYTYFFRTVPRINEYIHVYIAMFKRLGLKNVRVSTLTDKWSSGYYSLLTEHFKKEQITLATQQQLSPQLPSQDDIEAEYGDYLNTIKKAESRIIIMDVYVDKARKIMCLAYLMGMTMDQGYMWFLPHVYVYDWYANTSGTNCTKDQMEKALKGYLTLSHSFFDKTSAVAVGGMNGTHFYTSVYRKAVAADRNAKYKEEMYRSEYGAFTYDAIWVYAIALQALYDENPAYIKYIHTPHATSRYVAKIHEAKFQGVSGPISFNANGDRSGIIEITQFYDMDEGFLKETDIGTYSNGNLDIVLEKLLWRTRDYSTTEPPTVYSCEWEKLANYLNLSCSAALLVVVLPVFLLLVLIVAVAAFFAFRSAITKYKLAADIASKLRHNGGFVNLDENEIPRNHVVLNRKLGEGAFGTVYGGEAYISGSWIGVAVKTLKPGSNSEDRLDFLREADIMKRFDHKNIAKLLGVSTREEPAYAVMEFMLYGDLRVYLLSRRELVGMNTKEAEDVSGSSLTRMAMDIIEGIHYLHTREYVHRDIACRNCLVSANKTIKIGDFGMARRVYDDGLYLFTRRGKLPVRWMAPESFVEGIFTYKTDIWSLGVLLYEIVTFGSTPYQMLTNGEVYERVKSGATLNLPEECTDELKTLLLACWHKEPSRRPSAVDVYATLAENDNMIHPLLDCPVYAEIQDCDTVEVNMSLAPLKPSTILKRPFLRQSSSVISVDTGMSTMSRCRNQSDVPPYKRSASSNRRRSSHSVVDLFSLIHPTLTTQVSSPSPTLSPEQGSSFHFSGDSRRILSEASQLAANTRYKHLSGSHSVDQQVRTENAYLLTTRSCAEIDDSSYSSHAPLVHSTGETVI